MPTRIALAAAFLLAATHAALASQTTWRCDVTYDGIEQIYRHRVVIDTSRNTIEDERSVFVNGGKNLWSDEYERFADTSSAGTVTWGTRLKTRAADALIYKLNLIYGSYTVGDGSREIGHGACTRDGATK